jgi:hypothetical protein
LRDCPSFAKHVRVEGKFKSNSTLLLLSIPVVIWDLLPDNLACTFIAHAKSINYIQDGAWHDNDGLQSWLKRKSGVDIDLMDEKRSGGRDQGVNTSFEGAEKSPKIISLADSPFIHSDVGYTELLDQYDLTGPVDEQVCHSSAGLAGPGMGDDGHSSNSQNYPGDQASRLDDEQISQVVSVPFALKVSTLVLYCDTYGSVSF